MIRSFACASNTHAGLPDLASSGHPAAVIADASGRPGVADAQTALTNLRRGLFNVLDYVAGSSSNKEAVFSGLMDGTDAMNAALADAIAERGTLYLPPGANIAVSDQLTTITGPCGIYTPPGWRHGRIVINPSYAGPVFVIDDCWRNGEQQVDDLTYDPSIDTSGVSIVGIEIYSTDWNDEHAGIWFTGRTDLAFMDSVMLMYLSGVALSIVAQNTSGSGFMRECLFRHVRIEQCGNAAAGFNCLEIDTALNAGDGTNHLTFQGLELVYNNGPVVITNTASSTEVSRRLSFSDVMLHGKGDGATAQNHHLLILEGRLTDVVFDRIKANASVPGYGCVLIRSANGYRPREVTFAGLSLTSCSGDGLVVEGCDNLVISGTSDPASISGQELVFGADSTTYASIDLRVRSSVARSITVDPSVWPNVSGIVGPFANYPKADQSGSRSGQMVYSVTASTGSAVAVIGAGNTNQGTVTAGNDAALGWASTWTGAGSGGSIAGPSQSTNTFMPGSSTQKVGAGVRFLARGVRPGDASYDNTGPGTGSRFFVGLTNQTAGNAMGSDDPAGHRAGFQRIHVNGGKIQTNWFVTTKNNATESLVDTGIPFVAGHIYDMELGVAPGSAGVSWRIIDWTSGTSAFGVTTSSLPATNVNLRALACVSTVDAVVRSVTMLSVTAWSLS